MLTGKQKYTLLKRAFIVTAVVISIVAWVLPVRLDFTLFVLVLAVAVPVFAVIRRKLVPDSVEPASSLVRALSYPPIAGFAAGTLCAVYSVQAADADREHPSGFWILSLIFYAPPIAFVVTGIFLRLISVPHPWSIAGIGVVASFALVFAVGALTSLDIVALLLICPTVGYLWAAFIAGTVVQPGTRIIAAVALLATILGLFAAVGFIREHGKDTRLETELSALSIPLMRPEVPGYELVEVEADTSKNMLLLTLRKPGDNEYSGGDIGILILPVPADFSPPQRCGPVAAYFMTTTAPCTEAEPGLWTPVGNNRPQLMRLYGNALVFADGSRGVPADHVRQAVMSMRETTVEELIDAS